MAIIPLKVKTFHCGHILPPVFQNFKIGRSPERVDYCSNISRMASISVVFTSMTPIALVFPSRQVLQQHCFHARKLLLEFYRVTSNALVYSRLSTITGLGSER